MYIYADPISGIPFYVGKGCNNRAYVHLYQAENSEEYNYKLNKIRKILRETWQGPVIAIIKDSLSEEEAFSLEKETIAFYGRKDLGLGPLLNMSDGGDGSSGLIFSEEARRKISESAKRKRKPQSEEQKKKHSECMKGRKQSEESNRKRSEKLKGREISKEAREKSSISLKKVPRTEEWNRKNSEGHKGKKLPPRTEEHCRKISENKKLYWEKKKRKNLIENLLFLLKQKLAKMRSNEKKTD